MAKKRVVQRPDHEILTYGGLSAYLANRKGDEKHTKGALTINAGPKGVDLNPLQRGYMKGSFSNAESIKNTGNIYGEEYGKAIGKVTVGELAAYYAPLMRGVDDETVANIASIMDEVKGKTRGSIEDAYEDAQLVLSDKHGRFTPADKANAKKTLRKYTPVIALFEKFDEYTFEGVRPEAVDITRVSDLKNLSDRL